MAKKEYIEGSFGAYFVKLIKDHNYSQAKFAAELGVSKTYLFDVFNGRVKPPAPEMQDRIIEVLHLNNSDRDEFYSKAAEGRHELPKDIVEYLTNNKTEIDGLRERMRV
ncbi:MAG: helix-turn-helix transcriptional regulator [Ruminococcaceae bacterium]|nr:helix-turn-helix transcriptional regulator [Oscillospiraceae bacterium]